ncbi:MAG: hypothetical protein ACYC3B_03305 [Sedimentisphaerales bacterium]
MKLNKKMRKFLKIFLSLFLLISSGVSAYNIMRRLPRAGDGRMTKNKQVSLDFQ